MKSRKVVSLIVTIAMMAGIIASFATAVSAAESETPVFVRMDYPSVKTTPQYKDIQETTTVEMKSDNDARNAYYEIYGIGSKDSFGPHIVLPRAVANGEKMVVSFDYKVENYSEAGMSGTPGAQIQYWNRNRTGGGLYNEVGSLNTISAWPGDWANSAVCSDAASTATWARYDFVVDNANQKVALYHNGTYLKESSTAKNGVNDVITDIRLNLWTPGTVSVDNITAATTDALKAENATIKVSGKNMYINYPSTIANDSTIPTSAYLEEVGGSGRIQANAVSQPTKSIIKLELASEPRENTEYRIVYNDEADIKNIIGGSMNDDVTYINAVTKETTNIINETFDSSKWNGFKIGESANIPENYKFLGQTWTENIVVDKETGNESNTVMNINSVSDDGKNKFMYYTLPDEMPSEYKLNVSYKIKMDLESITDTTIRGFFQGIDATVGDSIDISGLGMASSSIMFRMYKDSGISYPAGRWWCGESRTNLIDATATENNKWYQIDAEYDVKVGTSVTASYNIKKGGTTTKDAYTQVATVKDITIANNSKVKDINYVYFCLYSPKKEVSQVFLDDFNVSYTRDKVALKKARMLDAQGNVIMPDQAPENTISGMQFTLTKAVDGVTAKLDGNTIGVTQNDNVYEVAWNEFLSADEHTVELTYGTETYTYTFTPTVAQDLIIKSFGAYVGDVKAEKSNLTPGTTVTVKAKIANPTGDATKTACVIYALCDGDAIKSVNYASKVIGTDIAGEDVEKTFEIPAGITNPNLKIFLWDSIDGMFPLTESDEI